MQVSKCKRVQQEAGTPVPGVALVLSRPVAVAGRVQSQAHPGIHRAQFNTLQLREVKLWILILKQALQKYNQLREPNSSVTEAHSGRQHLSLACPPLLRCVAKTSRSSQDVLFIARRSWLQCSCGRSETCKLHASPAGPASVQAPCSSSTADCWTGSESGDRGGGGCSGRLRWLLLMRTKSWRSTRSRSSHASSCSARRAKHSGHPDAVLLRRRNGEFGQY